MVVINPEQSPAFVGGEVLLGLDLAASRLAIKLGLGSRVMAVAEIALMLRLYTHTVEFS